MSNKCLKIFIALSEKIYKILKIQAAINISKNFEKLNARYLFFKQFYSSLIC